MSTNTSATIPANPDKLLDIIRYFKSLPNQINAVRKLASYVTNDQLEEVLDIYRKNVDVHLVPVVEKVKAIPCTTKVDTTTYLYLYWTGDYYLGFRVFSLNLMSYSDGVSTRVDKINMLSGTAGTQYEAFVDPRDDYSKSYRCIPENIYTIGKVEDSQAEGQAVWSDALGRFWALLTPVFNLNNRSDIGMHDDANRAYSAGSAGCLCPFTRAILDILLKWLGAKARPEFLMVDLGKGWLKTSKYAKYIPSNKALGIS